MKTITTIMFALFFATATGQTELEKIGEKCKDKALIVIREYRDSIKNSFLSPTEISDSKEEEVATIKSLAFSDVTELNGSYTLTGQILYHLWYRVIYNDKNLQPYENSFDSLYQFTATVKSALGDYIVTNMVVKRI
jgi:hypothetical protein